MTDEAKLSEEVRRLLADPATQLQADRLAVAAIKRWLGIPEHQPPYDGTPPCPACPVLVRGLHATAHNAVGAFEAAAKGQGDWSRAYRKMVELAEAVREFQPVVDGHFADPAHSHGDSHPYVTELPDFPAAGMCLLITGPGRICGRHPDDPVHQEQAIPVDPHPFVDQHWSTGSPSDSCHLATGPDRICGRRRDDPIHQESPRQLDVEAVITAFDLDHTNPKLAETLRQPAVDASLSMRNNARESANPEARGEPCPQRPPAPGHSPPSSCARPSA